MTAAATAARQQADQLLDMPCTVTSGHAIDHGVVFTRRCTERDGHLDFDIPHSWSAWTATGETVTDDPKVELDF